MLWLKREAACFACLGPHAASAPLPIDAINLDLASADYFAGRASLWVTLDVRSAATNGKPIAVLGFDENFLRPFTRALIEAAASREPHRMTILAEPDGKPPRPRVVEYVTGPGVLLRELMITPHDAVIDISSRSAGAADDELLLQLPRSDSFLRAFAEVTYLADQTLRATLRESESLARRRGASLPAQP